MAFYSSDAAMAQILADLVRALEVDGRSGLAQQLSITWLRYPASLLAGNNEACVVAAGASWGGSRQRYPASVVKLVYLIAAEAWLQQGLIEEGPELRRALAGATEKTCLSLFFVVCFCRPFCFVLFCLCFCFYFYCCFPYVLI